MRGAIKLLERPDACHQVGRIGDGVGTSVQPRPASKSIITVCVQPSGLTAGCVTQITLSSHK